MAAGSEGVRDYLASSLGLVLEAGTQARRFVGPQAGYLLYEQANGRDDLRASRVYPQTGARGERR